ncbi:MAG: hypothetical protein MI867_17060 [Pseudomonadales bacterium]|nr:hypothetical protein [Pseudomonadales bacterium]
MDLAFPPQLESDCHAESPEDELLQRCFSAINKKYFKNQLQLSVTWEVPKQQVQISERVEEPPLNSSHQELLNKATKALSEGNTENAIEYLTPVADAGHRESQLAICHLLKRSQGNWQKYAQMYNEGIRVSQLIPASSFDSSTQTLFVHPHLYQRNVPQFVLRYLIFHECSTNVVNAHELNKSNKTHYLDAPHRDRAIMWLRKEGFPEPMDKTLNP